MRNVFGPVRSLVQKTELLIENLSLLRPAAVQAASRDARSELNAVLEMDDDAMGTPSLARIEISREVM